jgi:hypothetical protein
MWQFLGMYLLSMVWSAVTDKKDDKKASGKKK